MVRPPFTVPWIDGNLKGWARSAVDRIGAEHLKAISAFRPLQRGAASPRRLQPMFGMALPALSWLDRGRREVISAGRNFRHGSRLPGRAA